MFFFFNDTATTEIYTLSLHDALPIFNLDRVDEAIATETSAIATGCPFCRVMLTDGLTTREAEGTAGNQRSEEHTSELQSRQYLVCRLLLEKKKNDTLFLLLSSFLCYI